MNTNKSPAKSTNGPSYLNVFVVEEFDTGQGRTAKRWTKVGAAFPHKDGAGFSIELKALPLDGRLVVRPPSDEETATK